MSVPKADLPPYEVVTAQMEAVGDLDGHEHVSFVDTQDPDGGQTQWSVSQILDAIRDGERFVVASGGAAGERLLQPTTCRRCGVTTVAL